MKPYPSGAFASNRLRISCASSARPACASAAAISANPLNDRSTDCESPETAWELAFTAIQDATGAHDKTCYGPEGVRDFLDSRDGQKRIAQAVLAPVTRAAFSEVDDLDEKALNEATLYLKLLKENLQMWGPEEQSQSKYDSIVTKED